MDDWIAVYELHKNLPFQENLEIDLELELELELVGLIKGVLVYNTILFLPSGHHH
jgi:hypothetical protein